MPRVLDLSGCNAKVERAKKHLAEFHAAVVTYETSRPWEYDAMDEATTGDWIIVFHLNQPVPASLAPIVGDVIHNLRCAMDHLAWELVDSNDGQPDRFTAFPTAETASGFEKTFRAKLRGARAEGVEAVRNLEPYRHGSASLHYLHQLDIFDKHRMLVPTVASVRSAAGFGDMPIGAFNFGPLRDGSVLYRICKTDRDKGFTQRPHLTIGLTFGKPTVLAGAPMPEYLDHMCEVVSSSLDEVARTCSGATARGEMPRNHANAGSK